MIEFLVFMLGASLGSFAKCYTDRYPNYFSSIHSCCPQCNHPLTISDLIPIISYLFLKGKCLYCKKSIPINYFISELVFGLCSLFIYLIDPSIIYLLNCLITLSLVYIATVCDIKTQEIPDIVPIGFLIVILLTCPTIDYKLSLIILFVGSIFSLLGKIGYGDIKLISIWTLYISDGIFLLLFIASFCCLFWSLANNKKDAPISFAPFLCIAYLIIHFFTW